MRSTWYNVSLVYSLIDRHCEHRSPLHSLNFIFSLGVVLEFCVDTITHSCKTKCVNTLFYLMQHEGVLDGLYLMQPNAVLDAT